MRVELPIGDEPLLPSDVARLYDQMSPAAIHRQDKQKYDRAEHADRVEALKATRRLGRALRARLALAPGNTLFAVPTLEDLQELHYHSFAHRFLVAGEFSTGQETGTHRAWRPAEFDLLNRQVTDRLARRLSLADLSAFTVARLWAVNAMDFTALSRNNKVEFYANLFSAILTANGVNKDPIPATDYRFQTRFYAACQSAKVNNDLAEFDRLVDKDENVAHQSCTKPSPFLVRSFFHEAKAPESIFRIGDPLAKCVLHTRNPSFPGGQSIAALLAPQKHRFTRLSRDERNAAQIS